MQDFFPCSLCPSFDWKSGSRGNARSGRKPCRILQETTASTEPPPACRMRIEEMHLRLADFFPILAWSFLAMTVCRNTRGSLSSSIASGDGTGGRGTGRQSWKGNSPTRASVAASGNASASRECQSAPRRDTSGVSGVEVFVEGQTVEADHGATASVNSVPAGGFAASANSSPASPLSDSCNVGSRSSTSLHISLLFSCS
mmetsp:Transcript_61977/g.145342  ORF Transcript_61977/g.145342 Transcript_61977/m.145342 type:complete len:200 (+) Transcript_61977:215-814(+)